MRPSSTFNNVYLALLLLELAVVAHDALFGDSTSSEWVRIIVLAIGITAFYGWSRGLWSSWKWAWRLVFLFVLGWFFVYFPFETYREWETMKRTIDEFGVSVIAPGYLVFYLFHIPLFYALYSAAFGRSKSEWYAEHESSPR